MWAAFKDLVFLCIQGVYGFVGDWGMAILLVTIIFRVIITPLTRSQIKSSYDMTKMQPKMQELQEKFADDQVRLQEEMQKLYADAHFNPLAGCLPILLQMPIFVALFQVLQEMGDRVGSSSYQFYNLVKDLTLTPATSLQQGFWVFLPYLILLIVFAGATFLPMVLQQKDQPNSPQKRQTMFMSIFMSLFMLWIGWRSPAGVLLFWGASSVYAVIQQRLLMRHLKKEDEEKEAQVEDKPVAVDVTRKPKKKRPRKKH